MISIKDICIKTPVDKKSDNDFMGWFNGQESVEDALRIGKIDFNEKIFDAKNRNILGDVSEKTCLEIGFGGGRILNEACNHFKHALGIDIHEAFERTNKILINENKKNFSLIHRDNIETIDSDSVDFVYSFIVFQHFDSWSEAEYYLDMINRVLKKDGVAMIYFGKDKNKEFACEPKRGHHHWWSSLRVSHSFIKERLSKFDIIETGQLKNSNQIFCRFRKK